MSVGMTSPPDPVSNVCVLGIITHLPGSVYITHARLVSSFSRSGVGADVSPFGVSARPQRSRPGRSNVRPVVRPLNDFISPPFPALFRRRSTRGSAQTGVFDQEQKPGVALCTEDRLAYITQDYTHHQGYTQRSVASAACRKWLMLRAPLNQTA